MFHAPPARGDQPEESAHFIAGRRPTYVVAGLGAQKVCERGDSRCRPPEVPPTAASLVTGAAAPPP